MTVSRHNTFLRVLAFLIGAAVPGCGDGKPYIDTSLTEATVTGVVTAKGEPVTAGDHRFNPQQLRADRAREDRADRPRRTLHDQDIHRG